MIHYTVENLKQKSVYFIKQHDTIDLSTNRP
ncbi:hypothetical protein [Escherichia phage CLB_P2]|nr:hypothetical protein [Escherichia phage CLB_P2]